MKDGPWLGAESEFDKAYKRLGAAIAERDRLRRPAGQAAKPSRSLGLQDEWTAALAGLEDALRDFQAASDAFLEVLDQNPPQLV